MNRMAGKSCSTIADQPASAMNHRHCLLLFTRYPEAGRTKTRLIPLLGAEGAARLQRVLTEKILLQAKALEERLGIQPVIHYDGGSRKKMEAWLGPGTYIPQVQGDLGSRMQAAFIHAFAAGAGNAVLIGSDIPEISTSLLAEAFAALINSEVVIGPSRDGGYYLIGMRATAAEKLYPLIFAEMVWSTGEVFAITRSRLLQAACIPALLPVLNDIDTPEDLNVQIDSSGV